MSGEAMNRIQEHFGEATEEARAALSHCAESAQRAIDRYPLAVALGVFAVGLGCGAMIGCSLAEPLGFRQRRTAETLGRRILAAVSDMVPETVSRQWSGQG